jgi:hypothetical protein
MAWLIYLALAQQAIGPAYFPKSYEKATVRCEFFGRSRSRLNAFEIEWYSQQLRASGEPSLLCQAYAGRADSLRFLWLRSFDPALVVRIDGLGSTTPQLTAVELDGSGGGDPGKVRRRLVRQLTEAEGANLRKRLVAQNPLTLPIGSNPCDGGIDGSQWIIERATGHRYKMVNAWSPESGPIYAAGLVMLHLTGWKFSEVY